MITGTTSQTVHYQQYRKSYYRNSTIELSCAKAKWQVAGSSFALVHGRVAMQKPFNTKDLLVCFFPEAWKGRDDRGPNPQSPAPASGGMTEP